MLGHKTDHRSHKKGFGLFGLFRALISLTMLCVLGLGLYLAFRNLSGTDPLQINPGNLKNIIFSQETYDLAKNVLTVDPQVSWQRFKTLLHGQNISTPPPSTDQNNQSKEDLSLNKDISFRFALVADPHNDNNNLFKALQQAKRNSAEFIIGLGDYTDVGTIDELNSTKREFDAVSVDYYVTAGDHDLWDARDKGKDPSDNFQQVFGDPYSSFVYKGVKFLLIYDSDNYKGVDPTQMEWINSQLESAAANKESILVFTHIPLYHPSSDHVMGKVEGGLMKQSTDLIDTFKKYNVTGVFAGDAHFFSEYTEPRTSLPMTVVGALTSIRNLQAPRFALVDVFTDGSYNIQDTEISN